MTLKKIFLTFLFSLLLSFIALSNLAQASHRSANDRSQEEWQIYVTNTKETRAINALLDKIVTLKSISSGCYLDAKNGENSSTVVTNSNPQIDNSLQWRIERIRGEFCALKSVSSGCYLDGRGEAGQSALVTNRNPQRDYYLQWDIKLMNQSVNGTNYALRSPTSRSYLDGRSSTGAEVLVTKYQEHNLNFLLWEMNPIN